MSVSPVLVNICLFLYTGTNLAKTSLILQAIFN
jgi:hypothetical protein